MNISDYIKNLVEKLEKAGFEAYIVGGCVRDLLMGKEPKDWDITTNARPEEITKIFGGGKYENKFGTVLVPVSIAECRLPNVDFPVITKGLKISKKDKEEAIKIAKEYLKKVKCPAHGLQHSVNVAINALKIAIDYRGINLDIMEIGAYWHDVGRVKYDDFNHVKESLNIARQELSEIFSKDIVETINKIISHGPDFEMNSLEQQIVNEADKIDMVDIERFKISLGINLEEYFYVLKSKYNSDYVYKKFKTEKGKELLIKGIEKFNEENFDIKLPNFKETKEIVEITTYRSEQGYSDRRHPDQVKFEDSLERDLERRDFTVNAMAIQISDFRFQISDLQDAIIRHKVEIVDLFGGRKDLEKKIIRAVGEPADRFKEDALRMMRAVRLACQLGFTIEPKTERAIKKMAGSIKFISQERIRDELIKILETDKAYEGIMFLYNNKLLQYILPELERGAGVDQNRHHIYTVFNHSVLSLKYCSNKDWRVKFACLLHDIAKPQTKRFRSDPSASSGQVATFYNHDIIGAKIVKKIMQRLKFSNEDTEKVTNLIRHHMFYYNVGEVMESSVRRLIKKVGEENLKDLIDLRIADRLGSGVPKAKPYKLRHLEYMMRKVRKDPISAKMLKINGDDLMKLLKITPGPKIGAILDVLLSEVIEDPNLNDKKYLEKRSQELNKMELDELRKKAKGRIEEKKMEDDKELKGEFWVK